MFYTTKNIISDYLIKESERAVLLFGGDSYKKNLKITDLFAILDTHFKGKINRSRLKLMSIDSEALPSSSLRRTQRFISDFILDADLIAKMIYSFLADKENLSLCSDCLTADREFIDDTRFKYLNGGKIRYYIRIKYLINFY